MNMHSIIVVGSGSSGRHIAQMLLEKKYNNIVGFVDDGAKDKQITLLSDKGGYQIPVIGGTSDLMKVIQKYRVSGVILAHDEKPTDHLLTQIIECHKSNVAVYEMPALYAKLTKRIPVRHIDHHWIMSHLTEPPHDFYVIFHDITNYILSVLGIMFLLPFFPIIALAIKMGSRGPVFYRQKRIGKNSRKFDLIKFRTMVKDADKSGDAWTEKNDNRITKVGRLLRKFRLDELPQLINVIKGDMALIGPRPDALDLADQFRKEIPFYDYRHLVRPGITGWAQVNHGNTCSIEGTLEKLQYDLYWIKNRSFWLDLKIIFKSIKVILTGYGAV